MPDQANELRQLVLRAALNPPAAEHPPQLITVASGKGGVGVTSVAVNLAIALAGEGRRAVLVDADLQKSDAGLLCELAEPQRTVADILSGRLTVHEALFRGPGGIQVVPGAWGQRGPIECSAAAQNRLISQLKCLGAHTDYVVIDAGCSTGPAAGELWRAADLVLLVTTADVVSLMDAYAAVKSYCTADARPTLRTLVNQASHASAAVDVQQRLSRACRRFLGLKVQPAGHLPRDPAVEQATGERRPFLVAAPGCEGSRALVRLAQSLVEATSEPRRTAKPVARRAAASA